MSEKIPGDYIQEKTPELQEATDLVVDIAPKILKLRELVKTNPAILETLKANSQFWVEENERGVEPGTWTDPKAYEKSKEQLPVAKVRLEIVKGLEIKPE